MIFNSLQFSLALEYYKPKVDKLIHTLGANSDNTESISNKDLESIINNKDVYEFNNYIEEILRKELQSKNIYRGLDQYLKRFEAQGVKIDIGGKLLPSALAEIAAHREELQKALDKRKER